MSEHQSDARPAWPNAAEQPSPRQATAERRPIVRAGLVIAAAAAALALWAGLSAAGADTNSPSGGNPRVVFTQTEGGNGGHHCHRGDGSTGDQDTTPQATNQSSSV